MPNATGPVLLTGAAADAAEEVAWHLQQADLDNLFTVLSGMVSLQWFALLSQLLTLGAVLVVVFVIAMRRF